MISLLISILCQLDTAVINRKHYIAEREDRIATITNYYTITEGKRQYEFAQELWQEYHGFNNDSALYYAEVARQLASTPAETQAAIIHIANCVAVGGNYTEALDMLLPLHDSLQEDIANEYYKTLNLTYIWQAEFSTTEEGKQEARKHIIPLRKLSLETEKDSIWRAQETALIWIDDHPDKARDILLPIFSQLDSNSDYVRYLANTLGSCYQRLYWQNHSPQMQDSALLYYATSALSDMKHGVMEHASLREVALLLFQRGDIERAYRYMNCCIQDAQQSQARLRTVEMAGDMPLIIESYHQRIQEQQRNQQILTYSVLAATIFLAVILLVVIVLLRRWQRLNTILDKRNKQLHQLNTQLAHLNAELTDSNRIRDAYITQYMTECSDIIEAMTQHYKGLRRIALSDNPKQLFRLVQSNEIIERTLREFYLHFDETFLSLFPDFIEDFNHILPEEERFVVPSTADSQQPQHLNTELRVYALVRLGITRSEDIARFLRISVKTVYNYRTHIRNSAIRQLENHHGRDKA